MVNNGILLTPAKHFYDKEEFRQSRVQADEEEERELFEYFGGGSYFEIYKMRVASAAFRAIEADDMREKMSEVYGVISLSDDPLNQKMWNQYAGNDGVVIGFSAIDETTEFGLTARFLEWGPIWKVDYDPRYKDVLIRKNFSNIVRVLTLKDPCFDFESEWRFIGKLEDAAKHPDGDEVYYTLPAYKNMIQRVIFGCESDPRFMHDLCKWLGEKTTLIEKIIFDQDGVMNAYPYTYKLPTT